MESCFNNKYNQAQTLSNFLQQCTAVQTSITYFHTTSTVGRFIHWSTCCLQSFVESCFINKYSQAQTLSSFLQQCTAVQTSITYFHTTPTGGRFIHSSTSIQRAISSTRVHHTAWRRLETRALGTLTLSLLSHPLQTTNKSVKFEILKPRCFLFRISV